MELRKENKSIKSNYILDNILEKFNLNCLLKNNVLVIQYPFLLQKI